MVEVCASAWVSKKQPGSAWLGQGRSGTPLGLDCGRLGPRCGTRTPPRGCPPARTTGCTRGSGTARTPPAGRLSWTGRGGWGEGLAEEGDGSQYLGEGGKRRRSGKGMTAHKVKKDIGSNYSTSRGRVKGPGRTRLKSVFPFKCVPSRTTLHVVPSTYPSHGVLYYRTPQELRRRHPLRQPESFASRVVQQEERVRTVTTGKGLDFT